MKEEWRDIPGFEGIYQISNTGKVLSLNYRNRGYAKELTPKINNKGYLWVQLFKNKKSINAQMHRLVATVFVDNPNGFPIINHKDENPFNNSSDNLEWCTRKYNYDYSFEKHGQAWIEKIKQNLPKSEKKRKRTSKPYAAPKKDFKRVIQRNQTNGTVIKVHNNIATIVREYGYNNTSIKECCLGKRHTAYGYKWEFE